MDASRMCGKHPFRFSGEIRTYLEIGKNGLGQTISLRWGEQDIPAAAGGNIFEQFDIGGSNPADICTLSVFLIQWIIVILCHRIQYTAGKLPCGIDRKNGQKIAIEKSLFQDIGIPLLLKSISRYLACHPLLSDENDWFYWFHRWSFL